jgi:hypothetical protein
MQGKWMSTSDLARLIEDVFPASQTTVREYCEDGRIPPKFAKRPGGRDRGHWKIAWRGLGYILKTVFELDEDDIAEVRRKAPANFRMVVAA